MATSTVSLNEAAEILGVHYMTAYRYVRTGRIPGQQVNGEWRVEREDLDSFTPGVRGRRGRGQRATPQVQKHFEDRLIAGDETGAWKLTEDALTGGTSPREFYADVLSPSLASIGARWSRGELSVAEEHTASAVAHRLVGRIGPFFARRGRRKGELVLGAPAMDLHSLPVAIIADLLRGEGFRVHDLGANVPAESFVSFTAGLPRVDAVGVCATTPNNEANIAELMQSLEAAEIRHRILGGVAVDSRDQALSLGATAYSSSADEAVQCFLSVSPSRVARAE